MRDPEDSGGGEGTGGGRETVELIDSETISYDRTNTNELYDLLFLGLGDVGLILNVSS